MISFHYLLGRMPEEYSHTDFITYYTILVSFPGWSKIFFSCPKMFRLAVGPTQHLSQWVPGARFLWVKWPGYKGDYSTPPHAEVKNECSQTPSFTLYAFMAFTVTLPFYPKYLFPVLLPIKTIHYIQYLKEVNYGGRTKNKLGGWIKACFMWQILKTPTSYYCVCVCTQKVRSCKYY